MRGFMEAVDGFNLNPCLYLKATLEAKETVAERWPGLCATLLKHSRNTSVRPSRGPFKKLTSVRETDVYRCTKLN